MALRTHTLAGFVTDGDDSVLKALADFLATLPDENIMDVHPTAKVRERKMWMEITVEYHDCKPTP